MLTPTRYKVLEKAFVLALRQVTKDQLPLLVSTFYAKLMMGVCKELCPDEEVASLWKRSTSKKMGTLLATMADAQVVKLSEDSPGVFRIVEVNKSSELYRKYKPSANERGAAAVAQDSAAAEAEGCVVVQELFVVPKRLQPLFEGDEGFDGAQQYDKKQVRDVFLRRVKRMEALKDVRAPWWWWWLVVGGCWRLEVGG